MRDLLIREQIERISQRIPEFKPHYMDNKVYENRVDAHEEVKMDWLESWLNSREIKFRGGMTEAPEDFQKRLGNFTKPAYPARAQRAGLQGLLKLQVRGEKHGSVMLQQLHVGDPSRTDSCLAAVERWR